MWRATERRLAGRRPLVQFFHDPTDPYSHLCLQAIPKLMAAYAVDWRMACVSPPDAGAAPEAARLAAYARRDAALLAHAHGLSFPETAADVAPNATPAAVRKLADARTPEMFVTLARTLGERLWNEGPGETLSPAEAKALFAEGDALRRRLGHYLGGTFYFEGEWCWGLDRLPYLEERLAFARTGDPVIARFDEGTGAALSPPLGGEIHFFLSFRSPYTYIAAARTTALARRLGARLVLRPVLPMVMRGLPVPLAKQLYIVRDTKREAERWGLPFGDMCDPVGAGAERGLAVLHRAIATGRGEAFVESFLRGVFAEGVDAASDAGLAFVAERAGLTGADVSAALADQDWRAAAEANRAELFDLGLWGVPSFHVPGRPAWWGQDRLWAVEQELQTRASTAAMGGAA
jgi:2-hydroxychromene-2-carboxylate isomerase